LYEPIFGVRGQPATVEFFTIAIEHDPLKVDLPGIMVTGSVEGPTLLITAGIHGCEYSGIESALRLPPLLDAPTLRGRVLILPIVNMPAFRSRSAYVCPVDGKNMNRVFPGRRDGSFSEKVAAVIMEEAVAKVDYVIDLHGADLVEYILPLTIFFKTGDHIVDEKSIALAEAYGLPYIVATEPAHEWGGGGTLLAAASRAGVPSVLARAGGQGRVDKRDISRHVTGILNVLKRVGMHDGVPNEYGPYTYIEEMVTPVASRDAVFRPWVDVGETVRSGQVVGTIHDMFGRQVETLLAPVSGVVLFVTTSPAVEKGFPLLGIGRLN